MRLFIALEFDKEIIRTLTDLQVELRNCGVTGRFTPSENLHMTLVFIGEYRRPEEVLDIMNRVDFEPLVLRLEGLQYFRDMFFARISDNAALKAYVRRLRRNLAERDIPFDRKKFSPHITLMRKVSFQKGVDGVSIVAPKKEIPVKRVSLFRSERGKHGMIYTELGAVE